MPGFFKLGCTWLLPNIRERITTLIDRTPRVLVDKNPNYMFDYLCVFASLRLCVKFFLFVCTHHYKEMEAICLS
jgi:hypothetical protein